MAATDVEALFPSLEARESARICSDVQNLDLEEALLFLSVNETEFLDPEDLDDL